MTTSNCHSTKVYRNQFCISLFSYKRTRACSGPTQSWSTWRSTSWSWRWLYFLTRLSSYLETIEGCLSCNKNQQRIKADKIDMFKPLKVKQPNHAYQINCFHFFVLWPSSRPRWDRFGTRLVLGPIRKNP